MLAQGFSTNDRIGLRYSIIEKVSACGIVKRDPDCATYILIKRLRQIFCYWARKDEDDSIKGTS